jgi:hypothetical protein
MLKIINWIKDFLNDIINLNDTDLRDMWLMERKNRRI